MGWISMYILQHLMENPATLELVWIDVQKYVAPDYNQDRIYTLLDREHLNSKYIKGARIVLRKTWEDEVIKEVIL